MGIIGNLSDISKSAILAMREKLSGHIAGTADRHKAEDVDYSGSIADASDVKEAVEAAHRLAMEAEESLLYHQSEEVLDHPYGSVTDKHIGSRTIQDPRVDDGTCSGMLTTLFNRVTTAVRALRSALLGKQEEWIAMTEGTGGAYTVTLDPAPTELYPGMKVTIIPHVTSTIVQASLNVNGLGARFIFARGYKTGAYTYASNSDFLKAGVPVPLMYDGTYWILQDYGHCGVVDHLSSTSKTDALSANMGRELADFATDLDTQKANADLSNVDDAVLKAKALEEHQTAAVLDHANGSVTDEKIGEREIDDPAAENGTHRGVLTALFNRVTTAIRALREDLEWKPGKTLTGEEVSVDAETTKTAGTGAEIFNDYRERTYSSANQEIVNNGNVASGSYSHAEGQGTTASGLRSHSQNFRTKASGTNSHAEGTATKAIGAAAHSEGTNTVANGAASHTEGQYTEANGTYSHAEGYHTIATSKSQHVQGEYNVPDDVTNPGSLGKYVHIVGNGASEEARSNAHTLDWDGNAWFAGTVSVGAEEKELAEADLSNVDDAVFKAKAEASGFTGGGSGGGSGADLTRYENSYTATGGETIVPVGIDAYQPEKDLLDVYYDNTPIFAGEGYTLNEVDKTITLTFSPSASEVFRFVVTHSETVADIATPHINDKNNPHGVTKAQVGLGNVDNTSDADKPVSTAQQAALDGKADKTELAGKADKTELAGKANTTDLTALANQVAALSENDTAIENAGQLKYLGKQAVPSETQKFETPSGETYLGHLPASAGGWYVTYKETGTSHASIAVTKYSKDKTSSHAYTINTGSSSYPNACLDEENGRLYVGFYDGSTTYPYGAVRQYYWQSASISSDPVTASTKALTESEWYKTSDRSQVVMKIAFGGSCYFYTQNSYSSSYENPYYYKFYKMTSAGTLTNLSFGGQYDAHQTEGMSVWRGPSNSLYIDNAAYATPTGKNHSGGLYYLSSSATTGTTLSDVEGTYSYIESSDSFYLRTVLEDKSGNRYILKRGVYGTKPVSSLPYTDVIASDGNYSVFRLSNDYSNGAGFALYDMSSGTQLCVVGYTGMFEAARLDAANNRFYVDLGNGYEAIYTFV